MERSLKYEEKDFLKFSWSRNFINPRGVIRWSHHTTSEKIEKTYDWQKFLESKLAFELISFFMPLYLQI